MIRTTYLFAIRPARLALGILCTFMTGAVLAASYQIGTQPNPVTVGQTAQLVITSTEEQGLIAQLPRTAGINWLNNGVPSTNTSIQIINGRRTGSFRTEYLFEATKEGEIILPDFTIVMGGKSFVTKGYKIRAIPYDGSALSELINLAVTFNGESQLPARLVVGQLVELNIRLFIDERLQLVADNRHPDSFTLVSNYFPRIDLENVVWRDYEQNQHSRRFLFENERKVQLGNKSFRLFEYTAAFYPLKSGKLEGAILHAVPYLVNGQGDTILGFFRGHQQVRKHPLRIPIGPVDVQAQPPLPAGGIYLGLVGDWQVELSLDNDNVTVGDDFTMRLAVTGTGSVEGLRVPELKIPGFNVYEPEVTRVVGKERHTGSISWVLVPRSAESELQTLTFLTLDPREMSYAVHAFQPQLTVSPGESSAEIAPHIVDSGEASTASQPERRLADIQYIMTQPSAYLRVPLWREKLPMALVVMVASPLLWLILLGLARRRERLAGNVFSRRRRQALRERGKVLRRLRKAPEDALPELVRQDVVPLVAALLGLPPGTTLTELKGQTEDTALRELLSQVENSGFLPGRQEGLDRERIMQVVRRIACLLLCLAWTTNTFGASFEEAAEAYNAGKYQQAAAYYAELREEGYANAAICYNLGNCAYAMGRLGEAIGWYERARRLAPGNTDILVNLNFVRRQLGYSPVGRADSPLELLASWRDRLRPDQWLLVAAIAWGIFWLVWAVWRWRGRPFPRACLLAALVVLLATVALVQQHRGVWRPQQAIVLQDDTPVYRLPREEQKESSFQLKAGEYARIVESRGEWALVRVDQNEGWLKSRSIQRFW